LSENNELLHKFGLDQYIYSFPQSYASYTHLDIGHKAVLCDDFAQPVFNGRHEFQPSAPLSDNAQNYLSSYASIGKLIDHWASRLNIDNRLHSACLDHMQIDRIYLPDMHNDLTKMKSDSTIYNRLLGIPNGLRASNNAIKPQASLPINGYNSLLEKLESIAKTAGVVFHTGSPVTPYAHDGKVQFRVRKNKLKHDVIVWCTNPTALIYNYCGYRLQAPAIKTSLLLGTLTGLDKITPKYWQIFDQNTMLLRFYIWQDKDRVAFTAEAACAPYADLQREVIKFIEIVLPSAKVYFQGS